MTTNIINRILPAPIHNYNIISNDDEIMENKIINTTQIINHPKIVIPKYMHRNGFIPYNTDDFGDGGAFPEIHVVQYPLDMGRPGAKSSAVITVDVDSNGQVRYDGVVKQGAAKDKIIKTTIDDLKESEASVDLTSMPLEQEEIETAEKTRLALEGMLDSKIKRAKPVNVSSLVKVDEPTYIRYTPNPNAPGFNPAANQRVIRMVEAQIDPMEPPKHRNKKIPRGPPSPPAPVLHSPPRKLTVKDQQSWKIPPCISNWKNARGYTIPLDKRLAADGRDLQDISINNKFASLSETLYIAERKAAEDLKVRNQIRKKMAMNEKELEEARLRELATKARQEKANILSGGSNKEQDYNLNEYDSGDGSSPVNESEEDRVARMQREKLRIERRKEREREIRMDNMKGKMRMNKVDRDEGRDISEKIALGMHKGTGKLTGEAMYDSRLFNQSAGMDSGFGAEDEYTTYSRPLFDRTESSTIYRPKRDDADIYGDADAQLAKLSDTSKFRPDKGFKGAEGYERAQGRDAPVQFEKSNRHEYDDSEYDKKRHRYE